MIDSSCEVQRAMRFHERLKTVTQPYRDALERRFPLLDPHLTRSAYRRTLERCFGFYAPLEAAWELACPPALRPDLARRRKTTRLIQDLFALGAAPPEVAGLPVCRALPSVDTYPRLLGSLYAVESFNLDGPTVSRSVKHRLGRDADRACRFFQAYGAHTELMWEALLANVETEAAHLAQRDLITDSACRTLQCFEQWLAAT